MVDVIVVGAGIAGICGGYYVRTTCPDRSLEVLEARDRIGGTWDLFRYPGIRSDSDMYTLGFSFRPWPDAKGIADGASIREYLQHTVAETGLDAHIRLGLRMVHAAWSSEDRRWTLTLEDRAGHTVERRCRFLVLGTGYYRYDEGYTPAFEGREQYRGQIVHPQHWPADLELAGRRVVVIGSGATAVTLVPELAAAGAQVTMVQRTPTYMVAMPSEDPQADWLRSRLPPMLAYQLIRWRNILGSGAFYLYTRTFPKRARRRLLAAVRDAVGEAVDVDEHFSPPYDPWDQRMCLVPDGDLFEAIKAGQVDLVTGQVAAFTQAGIALDDGRRVDADVVVTATGLQMQLLGGATLSVDGERVRAQDCRLYKGVMLSDVPNAAFLIGYTNASWTLKCELAAEWVARLLRHMGERGHEMVVPRKRDPSVQDEPAIGLSSGYVQRAIDQLPTQGSRAPWRNHQLYLLDRWMYRQSRLDDGVLEFR